MKILTVRQPWAQLIVLGAKVYETRSWRTSYRGELGIHASAAAPSPDDITRIIRALRGWEGYSPGRRAVYAALEALSRPLPRGVILGTVDLYQVQPTGQGLSPLECELGDHSPGRFEWCLRSPRLFDEPIPAKGFLGIWERTT